MKSIKKDVLIRSIIIGIIILSLPVKNNGQPLGNNNADAQALWEKISPYFSPPREFKDQYGSYRSPLKFYDGNEVKTPGDWKKRRKEILDKWNGMMGEWPPLIKNQKMEVIETTQKDGYTMKRVRFNWLPNDITEGYLLIPEGAGKKPGVITVFYEPETAAGIGKFTPNLDFANQLTKRGYVTLSIGTTATTKAKTYSLYYPGIENSQAQPLSLLAYATANAWYVMSKVPEVDSKRIGVMGLSYGGKWAMFASCLFDKFACAVWSDPGIVFDESRGNVNYWEPWYLGYYPPPWRTRGKITEQNPAAGLYPKLVKEGYDLHELHALMAPRPFLVSGGSEDTPKQWIPLNHTIAVNNLLGMKNRVAMTNRPEHIPDTVANEQAYMFLDYFLKYNGISGK